MFCPNCKNAFADNIDFCPHCNEINPKMANKNYQKRWKLYYQINTSEQLCDDDLAKETLRIITDGINKNRNLNEYFSGGIFQKSLSPISDANKNTFFVKILVSEVKPGDRFLLWLTTGIFGYARVKSSIEIYNHEVFEIGRATFKRRMMFGFFGGNSEYLIRISSEVVSKKIANHIKFVVSRSSIWGKTESTWNKVSFYTCIACLFGYITIILPIISFISGIYAIIESHRPKATVYYTKKALIAIFLGPFFMYLSYLVYFK